MDRWSWAQDAGSASGQQFGGVTLYDGENKTEFIDGELQISGSHIYWCKDNKRISLPVSLLVLAEEIVEGSFLSKKYFVVLHLQAAPPDRVPGPYTYSQHHQIRLRFKGQHFSSQVCSHIQSHLERKDSTLASKQPAHGTSRGSKEQPSLNLRGGLFRIEQDLQQRDAAVSRDVADAFQDFQKLMARAGEMVDLAKTISEKAKRQAQAAGDGNDALTADELVEFRSDLLALGVSGGVTKDDNISESSFQGQLASEICRLLEPIIRKSGGGLMSLTDAYCRLNRARGLNLVSPEDVLAATKIMEKRNMSLRLHQFSTGVRCLKLADVDSRRLCLDTSEFIEKQSTGCSIDTFAVSLSLSVAVARERLLAAESDGFICRDETASGIFFYPNKFLQDSAVTTF